MNHLHSSLPTRTRTVASLVELANTPLAAGINAICWPRVLPGDAAEVAWSLEVNEPVASLEEAALRRLKLSEAGRTAVEALIHDLKSLKALGLRPELNCVSGYPRDERPGPIHTDVYSFHVDRAPVETDTWLCTYYGAPSEGVDNDEVTRRVDDLDTRAELLKAYGGADDGGFQEFMADHSYDLHYALKPFAQPYSFGVGNLWRVATQWPGSVVPACVHRAPQMRHGERRLLLIC